MISIAFQTDKPLKDYGDLAARCEELGFDGVSLYNDLWYQPPWRPLAEMAHRTSRIRLGPAAVNPFTTHPVTIAGEAALLDELSEGRAYLGLGRGAWLEQIGVRPRRPIRDLREALGCLHALLHEGRPIPSDGAFPLPPDARLRWRRSGRRIPFMLGSWGERTIRRCLDSVDEVKLGGTAAADVARQKKKLLKDRARLVLGCVTVVDRDARAARERARQEALLYLPVIAAFDPLLQERFEQVERIRNLVSEGRHDQAGREISDEMLDRCALAGDPTSVIEACLRLRDAGVDRLEFGTPHGLSTHQGLDLLGRKVLPALRRV